ncbi:hypothetical protein ABZ738_23070 [Micromonospora sp. NPDC047793]|uniref:hypothetical protein n=1 Tax=unclassified Micromonospora TaxID=2617518 RepID=UPI00103527B0|nr:hypothetical protein [Verrucosispora sp. SN26_14.1]TBL34091.1 hypothetical protein EYA84_16315 [Verrucosispora sp. SN26_14.1]
MAQMSLFGPSEAGPDPKPADDRTVRLQLLITVKAAPNPSEKYGETVCVAGLRTDVLRPTWVRLYPINFRHLDSDEAFKKYDIISVDAKPARQDQRRESWKPVMDRIQKERHLDGWRSRQPLLDPAIQDSMCRLNREAQDHADAQSLALVRPKEVRAFKVTPHPGWTIDEQRRIEAYASQPDLFSGRSRSPLEAPRFKAAYHYRCHERGCNGHKQHVIDWELVALQRRLAGHSDAALREALETKFLGEMCAPNRDVAFYVGNQAKRVHVFSVLGVYWPKR